ncbi:MAG: hypothetical protein ACRDIZ_04385 [Actinomycetota bacterium]
MDIGQEVVVKDESGKVLGTGSLGPGRVAEVVDPFVACQFAFRIEDVGNADFYAVEVSHRGEIRFSKDELEQDDWHVALTLGG